MAENKCPGGVYISHIQFVFNSYFPFDFSPCNQGQAGLLCPQDAEGYERPGYRRPGSSEGNRVPL